MGPDALVTDEIQGGRELIERLVANGVDVRLAFWVKETDAGRWYLYLSLPVVDAEGPMAGYEQVIPVVQGMPEAGIELDSVKVVGITDSMAVAAWKAIRPRIPGLPFADRSPRPYKGVSRVNGSTLGGMDIDAAFIYPPQPVAPA